MTLFSADKAVKGAVALWNSKLSAFHFAAMDGITTAISVIDYAHHEIHAGSHYLYTDHVALDSAGTQDYLIVTPNTSSCAHMVFVMDGSAITQFELYEGADRVGTTQQTVGNSNRNSTSKALTEIWKGQSDGTTDGTRIHLYKGGSATAQSRADSSTRNDEEIILKQNTKYLFRITSGTNANLCNVRFSWYEHSSLT